MGAAPSAILPLSDHLINQIAAGEVIDRPASVVKELLENCLDAGARRIEVELGRGGLEFISVSDDGSGIAADEIHHALRRHWTSKISRTADLIGIGSLGFRGEALASIAAVADIEIVTRTPNDDHGWRVTAAAGQQPSVPVPYQGVVGTRVRVRDLFHNVPARRRFLKRPRTEFLQAQRVLRRTGFACPDAALSFTQAGSRALRLRPANVGETSPRWRSLFGEQFCRSAIAVEFAVDGIAVRGWVGGPELASNSSDLQYLAINGRTIRDRQIAHAVRLAYEDSLPTGKFPVYAVAMELPLDQVDVNVHPGKLEVRFVAVRSLHDLVYACVRRALGDGTGLQPTPGPTVQTNRVVVSEDQARYGSRGDRRPGPADEPDIFGRPLALVEDRFLIYWRASALRALDLRATWSEIIARRLKACGSAPSIARPLLIPERLPPNSAAWDDTFTEGLRGFGFNIDDMGPSGRVLRSVSAVLPDIAADRFILALSGALADNPELVDAIAAATAAAMGLGESGQPSGRMLGELARAGTAAGCEPTAGAFEISGAALSQWAGTLD